MSFELYIIPLIAVIHRIGIAIYVGVYIVWVSLIIVTFKEYFKLPTRHLRVFWAVVIVNPFLTVKLPFDVSTAFASIKSFSVLVGSALAWLFVVIVEDFTVVALYLLAGLIKRRLDIWEYIHCFWEQFGASESLNIQSDLLTKIHTVTFLRFAFNSIISLFWQLGNTEISNSVS